jgi:hypothetical protein
LSNSLRGQKADFGKQKLKIHPGRVAVGIKARKNQVIRGINLPIPLPMSRYLQLLLLDLECGHP